MSSQPIDGTHLQEKSPVTVIVLTLVTFGLYGLVWIHSVNKQLQMATGEDYNPTTRTIMLLIPLINLLYMWKVSNTASRVTSQGAGVIFILALVFMPVSQYMIQAGINEHAA